MTKTWDINDETDLFVIKPQFKITNVGKQNFVVKKSFTKKITKT